eukprot:TRINITY_DN4592_c0_g2_i1.p1 TRINITY_DN4592_c0_g2~~TRINITY_DN4592_c0_g2_i1.p1  ORF type:complete len:665 (-),score=155.03 TRINITY_DN4592_c0_g2_i1:338-2332(-)
MESQNEALKKDIAELLNVLNRLRTENDTYRQNFENLKAAHLTLQEHANNLQVQVSQSHEAYQTVTQQHTNTLQQLRAQMNAKEKEFEELRETLLPARDLELMRIKILEEVEGPHKIRARNLEIEIDKYRDIAYNVRREYELQKTTTEQLMSEHKALIEDMNTRHQHEVEALKSRIISLQGMVEERGETVAKIRSLQRDLLELQERHKVTVNELEEMRAERDKARVEIEQQKRSFTAQVNDEISVRKSLQGEKDHYLARCRTLESQVSDVTKQLEQTREQQTLSDQHYTSQRLALEDTIHDYSSEIDSLKMSMMDEKRQWKSEKEQNENTSSSLRQRLEESQHTVTLLQNKLSQTEREVSSKLKKIREEESVQLLKLQQEKSEIEARLEASLSTALTDNAAKENRVSQLQQDLVDANIRIKRLEEEKSLCEEKQRQNSHQLDSRDIELKERSKMIEELQSSLRQSQRTLQDYENTQNSLEQERDKLSQTLSILKDKEIPDLQRKLEIANKQVSLAASTVREEIDKENKTLKEKIGTLNKALEKEHKKVKKAILLGNGIKEKCSVEIRELRHQVQVLSNKALRADLQSETFKQQLELEASTKKKHDSLSTETDDYQKQMKMEPHWSWIDQENKTKSELQMLSQHIDTLSTFTKEEVNALGKTTKKI